MFEIKYSILERNIVYGKIKKKKLRMIRMIKYNVN